MRTRPSARLLSAPALGPLTMTQVLLFQRSMRVCPATPSPVNPTAQDGVAGADSHGPGIIAGQRCHAFQRRGTAWPGTRQLRPGVAAACWSDAKLAARRCVRHRPRNSH